jgi:anti-sigma B factor antagonist
LEDPVPVFESLENATDASATVVIKGEVDLDSAPELLALGIAHLADPQVHSLVLDLTGVTFMDSSTVGALVALRNRARQSQKALRIQGQSASAHRLLMLTGLDQIFEIQD